MNCFDFLGISKDSDKRTIKHAYAKLLKKYNPEDDPEGYQRLREAYDEALKYEKNKHKEYDALEDDDFTETINETESPELSEDISKEDEKYNLHNEYYRLKDEQKLIEEYDNELHEKKKRTIMLEDFKNKLNFIYYNINLRIDTNSWNEILNSNIFWNLDSADTAKGIMIYFICNHKFIPDDIKKCIEEKLKVSENEFLYSEKYGDEEITQYLKILNTENKVSYEHLEGIDSTLVDDYIDLKIKLCNSIEETIYKSDKKDQYYNEALNIYTDDPELYFIMAKYYKDKYEIDKAVSMLETAASIKGHDVEIDKQLGEFMFEKRKYKEAIVYLENFLKIKDDDEVKYTIAHCFYELGEYKKSLDYFEQLFKKYNHNEYIKSYVKNLKKKLSKKLVVKLNFNSTHYKIYNPATYTVEFKKKRKKAFIKQGIAVLIISFSIIGIMCYRGAFDEDYANSDSKKTQQSNNSYVNEYEKIKSLEKLKSAANNSKVCVSLSDIQPMDCYRLRYYDNSGKIHTIFMSNAEIKAKNYSEHVSAKVYCGKMNGKRVFFECSKDFNMTFKKNAKYIVKGYAVNLSEDMSKSLISLYGKDDKYFKDKYLAISPEKNRELRNNNNN